MGLRLQARGPDRLAAFFVEALGFAPTPAGVALGPVEVELAPASGAAYPGDVAGWNPLFQHFAIVTGDMAAALARLRRSEGWRPITSGGPQTLPPASGGVTAFKFRDPEGHPLELLALPGETPGGGLSVRIDHSAISVRDTRASVAFYRDLGFEPSAVSCNRGAAQARLDSLAGARVEVTALRFAGRPEPHLELLAYQGEFPRGDPAGVGDVAATRSVLAIGPAGLAAIHARWAGQVVEAGLPHGRLLLRDPDGHLLEIAPAGHPPS